MPIRVYLVQHAEAKPKEEDPERHLTERGVEEAHKLAGYVEKTLQIKVNRIIHSTKTRARQTAEILAEHVKPEKGIQEEKDLEPLADPSIWAKKLNELEEDVIIVGHLPHLSKLVSTLICGNPEIEIVKFRYSNMVCLERDDEGKWRILWILRPDIIP